MRRSSFTIAALALLAPPLIPGGVAAQLRSVPDTVVRFDLANPRPSQLVWRDPMTVLVYTRPGKLHAVAHAPSTLVASGRSALRIDRLPTTIGVVGGTLALIALDESILAETRQFARRIGLPPNHPSVDLRAGPFKVALPTTIGSGLYFIGDGLTSLAVAASLATHGALRDDIRARRVASEVVEALLASGAVAQIGKHVAGRQTPSEATRPRGRWRPFAPLSDYNRNVPAYDAFPSGHLATTTATVVVVALNYPEHRFVWPVGLAALGLLSFSMVNNGVHWASDYPLAGAIGVVVGTAVVDRGRTVLRMPGRPETASIVRPGAHRVTISPLVAPNVIGLHARF